MITLNGLYIEGTTYESGPRKAVIDTGSSGLFIPYDDLSKIQQFIPRSKMMPIEENFYCISLPCEATQPPFVFVFGGVGYKTDPRDFLDLHTRIDDFCCLWIYGTVINISDDWIIGIPFLKNVYTVFDAQQGYRVGFSSLA